MSEHGKCGVINLFFNKPCSSGTRKTETAKAQHKTGTVKEMLTKNVIANVDRHFQLQSWSDLLIYSSVYLETVRQLSNFHLEKQIADTYIVLLLFIHRGLGTTQFVSRGKKFQVPFCREN